MGGGFPPFPASAKPAVDVTPSPPKPAAPKPAAPKPAAAAAATATPAAGRGSAAATRPTEPELRDVSPSPSVASEFGGFADEVVEATPVSSSPFFDDSNDEPLMGSSEGAGAFEEEPSEEDIEYMQNMIRNPEMQKLMYPYLPEFMRNPETFEMLLSNPQYKDQLKDIMKQMKGSGVGGGMGGGMPDINSPEVQEQFAAMGMKPEDVLTQIMSDPELAAAFQNPKVQAAVMDCSTNPMNITKYQNDPEIMGTFEKLAALFPQAGPGGM
uniref:Protein TIC 40, chloroplastic n=1 Tax=Ostreococcus mediterraneus TaxID=1486918 RepID=A0A6U0EAA9_9CHLO